mgnify:CR=1 FL=1
MPLIRSLTIAIAGLGLIVGASATAGAGDVKKGLIRPGIGIAGVELGMTADQVRQVLGKPTAENKTPDGTLLFMSFHSSEIFGVYFDEATGRVRMLIVAVQGGKMCTRFGACLYRDGDLAKIKKHYGKRLLRFVDWDGSVTYRRLVPMNPRNVMVEFTPSEQRNAIVQVAMLYWDGKIDDSSLGGN